MIPTPLRPSRSVTIRPAVLEDLPAMARVHVDGWKTAYRGIVPDELLDRLTVESDLASGFGSGVKRRRPGGEVFVSVTPGGEIVGYALSGPNRVADGDFDGELDAIYVLRSSQGQGIGTGLVRETARYLLRAGHTSMIVWVLEQNVYRRFYERLGGSLVGKRVGEPHRLGGGPLTEISYGWKDIRPLASL
jgi:GNAT superfamily N-acetyltransferase